MKILFLVAVSILISACGSLHLDTANDFYYLRIGMSFTRLDSLLNFNGDKMFQSSFEIDKQEFRYVGIEVVNYVFGESGPSTFMNKNGVRIITKSDYFYLIFKENKLYTWGYLYEFKNDQSEQLNKIAAAIQKK